MYALRTHNMLRLEILCGLWFAMLNERSLIWINNNPSHLPLNSQSTLFLNILAAPKAT